MDTVNEGGMIENFNTYGDIASLLRIRDQQVKCGDARDEI